MRVVAIKPAFQAGMLVRVGDELDIPADAPGSWFAVAGTPRAEAALREKEARPARAWRSPHTGMREPERAFTQWDVLWYDPYARL